MFEMLEEAGDRVRLNTTTTTPAMEGARMEALECFDPIGAFKIVPKMVVDCSGDSDISAKAGVPNVLDDKSANMMAVTISFHMIGVDWDTAFAQPTLKFTEHAA